MGKVTISGGTRWKAYLERLAKKVEVRAGVMEDATTDEGERVAEYAAYNEFGTSRVPPRPFMRKTLERERENWIRGVGGLLRNGRSPDEALELVGTRMAEDIQKTIMSNMAPANAPSTIRRKNRAEAGRAGTLVDTGALVKSITHQVTK